MIKNLLKKLILWAFDGQLTPTPMIYFLSAPPSPESGSPQMIDIRVPKKVKR